MSLWIKTAMIVLIPLLTLSGCGNSGPGPAEICENHGKVERVQEDTSMPEWVLCRDGFYQDELDRHPREFDQSD